MVVILTLRRESFFVHCGWWERRRELFPPAFEKLISRILNKAIAKQTSQVESSNNQSDSYVHHMQGRSWLLAEAGTTLENQGIFFTHGLDFRMVTYGLDFRMVTYG